MAERQAEGLRVLVTAGAAGIGGAITAALVEAGAKVHVCDVSERVLEGFRASTPNVGATLADVSDEVAVDELFEDVRNRLGGLDVLVNNAGIAGPTGAVEDISVADWRRCIDIDLTGQFLCARRAVPLIKAAGGGAIINMSSSAGRFGYAFRTPYSAAKWGVIGFTQSLSKRAWPRQHPRQRDSAWHHQRTADGRRHPRSRHSGRGLLWRNGATVPGAHIASPHDRSRGRCCSGRVSCLAGGPQSFGTVSWRGRQRRVALIREPTKEHS